MSRVTLLLATSDYSIVKEVPAIKQSVIIDNLMQNVAYNVSLQSGNQYGHYGPKSDPAIFFLSPSAQIAHGTVISRRFQLFQKVRTKK